MFEKKQELLGGRAAVTVRGLGCLDLADTLECGQAFRYELIDRREGYTEYLTVVGDRILLLGQRERGELIVYGTSEDADAALDYFAADTDFEDIRRDVCSRTDSEWLVSASEAAKGIVILRQEPWETVFSFIVSQNNNIPRIRKIIRTLCAAYGRNLAEERGLKECPIKGKSAIPCDEICKNCGICYSFPRPEAVFAEPEKMESAKVGFRFKYLLDAAQKVAEGEVDLQDILDRKSYEYTLEKLKHIKGVGDKVASCAALFGFGNMEAFPIDVWMKRAIDIYFDGKLDPAALGPYAGVAQQYIFHYIRNIEQQSK